jgi:addiction module RelE/StbE family toxin
MAKIRWSVTARTDLQEIESYIARDSVAYAIRQVDRIVKAVESLESFPMKGRIVPELERNDMRELIYGSYRIVYLLQGEEVNIVRVVHGARGLSRLFEEEPWNIID